MFEIGDHGGLIVIGEDQNTSSSVHFSWDEGLTWQEIKISDYDFEITNIITDSDNLSQNFLVYGIRTLKRQVPVRRRRRITKPNNNASNTSNGNDT